MNNTRNDPAETDEPSPNARTPVDRFTDRCARLFDNNRGRIVLFVIVAFALQQQQARRTEIQRAAALRQQYPRNDNRSKLPGVKGRSLLVAKLATPAPQPRKPLQANESTAPVTGPSPNSRQQNTPRGPGPWRNDFVENHGYERVVTKEQQLEEQTKIEAERKQLAEWAKEVRRKRLAEQAKAEAEKKRLAEQAKDEAQKKQIDATAHVKTNITWMERLTGFWTKTEAEKQQEEKHAKAEAEKKRVAEQARVEAEKKRVAEQARVEAEKKRVAEYLPVMVEDEGENWGLKMLEITAQLVSAYYGNPITGDKPVHVRGYTRQNGTYVKPYNRSLPR